MGSGNPALPPHALEFTMSPRPLIVVCVLLIAGAVGCASPPWRGMAEAEIAAWKQLEIDAETAQQWRRSGFSAETAAPWIEADFDAGTAKRWDHELFSAEQAASWRAAEFSLDESIRHRARGLAPIRSADSP